MTDPRRSVDALLALRDLGVSVAIDDYGTGYSTLAYLRELPVQTLKIDKSFVTEMNNESINASIVGSTIGLARSLGMRVVAEGVEDAGTLDKLRDLGCDDAQGFYFGPAVATDELDALVAHIEAWCTRRQLLPTRSARGRGQLFAATSNTTSNSSSDAPEATGFAPSPEPSPGLAACAALAGPAAHSWKASSVSHCVTTK
ncbi:hypothetical protein BJF84_20390 [Rhodococcus sp. CUA-806]|nr:hypothetical protein BJF84_20390 [Rhodococcus sp. CUA-806]